MSLNRAALDITGHRFGRLVAFRQADGAAKKETYWICNCDCGSQKIISTRCLRQGKTKSCGCLQRDHGRSFETHGMSRSSEYRIWQGMIIRCRNPNDPSYPRYGGRGIQICARWAGDFNLFFADMGLRPSTRHSIDRVDNDGNYEPANCRWATTTQQARNRRITIFVTAFGETKPLEDWAEDWRCCVRRRTLRQRIAHGKNPEWSLTTPSLNPQAMYRPALAMAAE